MEVSAGVRAACCGRCANLPPLAMGPGLHSGSRDLVRRLSTVMSTSGPGAGRLVCVALWKSAATPHASHRRLVGALARRIVRARAVRVRRPWTHPRREGKWCRRPLPTCRQTCASTGERRRRGSPWLDSRRTWPAEASCVHSRAAPAITAGLVPRCLCAPARQLGTEGGTRCRRASAADSRSRLGARRRRTAQTRMRRFA